MSILISSLKLPVCRIGERAWTLALVAGLASLAALTATINFTVDPYQQFRKAGFYRVRFEQQSGRYLNAGIAKNHDYDSVVIGTSHAANFRIHELREIISFDQPVKLIITMASAYELHVTLTTVFENRDVRAVLLGLDSSSFQAPVTGSRKGARPFPMYLYEDGVFGRIRYVMGRDTLSDSVSSVKTWLNNPDDILYSEDRMFEWQHMKEQDFNRNRVLKIWNRKSADAKIRTDYGLKEFVENFDRNILPHLKNRKDTDFILFYPPYSVLKQRLMRLEGLLEDYLAFKKYVYSATRDLGNISLYDFQAAKAITHDLDNYKDLTHYHQNVNSWMLEQIAAETYRVSEDTVDQYNAELARQVEAFDVPL